MGSYRIVAGLVAAVVLFVSAGARAAGHSGDAPPSKPVRFDDLNLTTSAGVERLYTRIAFASAEVCPRPDRRDLILQRTHKVCVAEAIDRAVAAVNQPNLTAYHAARSGVYRVAGDAPTAR